MRMRRVRQGTVFLGSAALLAFGGGAQAATLAAQTCTRGTDVRVIEVVSPGDIGAACDLRYTREAGKNISVPFNASNSTSFCGQRARDLVESLASSGFTCANPGAFDKIAAMREAVDLDAILAGGPSGAAAAPAADAAPMVADASVGSAEPSAESLAAPSAASVNDAAALSAPTPPMPARYSAETPAAPPVHAAPYTGPTTADGGPVSLTPQGAAPVTRARYAVGRVVGAAPEDPRLSTLAALEVPPPDAQAKNSQATDENDDRLAAPSVPAIEPSAALMSGRPPLDAAVATVMAQAAAWNDGDLAGFMNIFWNSPDFTFVSGSTVTKGWDATYKRYREGYGEGGDLGRLVYSELEPKMIADDTASVVGRYAFARGEASSQGAMTLVLRRYEGAWRVVQHHMVADPAPTAAATPPPAVQGQ